MSQDHRLTAIRDTVVQWMAGLAGPEEVVRAACGAVAAGAGGDELAAVAGLSLRSVDSAELADVLEPLAAELGLAYYPPQGGSTEEVLLALMAGRTLAGTMEPRALAAWVHKIFGHDTLALAARLAELDDTYDLREHVDIGARDLDAETLAEARRIVETRPIFVTE